MALTDLRKVSEVVFVRCEIPEYNDEEFAFLPYSRDAARTVVDDAQVQEWKNNAMTTEYDPALFDVSYLKHMWKGCRGIPDPAHPGQRLPGPGIIRPDGTVVYLSEPVNFTEDNKIALVNSRPPTFYAWMQTAMNRLALANQSINTQQREDFRPEVSISPRESESELR